MTKEQFEGMVNYSIRGIKPDYWYTKEDFYKGYHFCYDWDELFIAPDTLEFECCTCHPLKGRMPLEIDKCPRCGSTDKHVLDDSRGCHEHSTDAWHWRD